jgi:hypothetical protein
VLGSIGINRLVRSIYRISREPTSGEVLKVENIWPGDSRSQYGLKDKPGYAIHEDDWQFGSRTLPRRHNAEDIKGLCIMVVATERGYSGPPPVRCGR